MPVAKWIVVPNSFFSRSDGETFNACAIFWAATKDEEAPGRTVFSCRSTLSGVAHRKGTCARLVTFVATRPANNPIATSINSEGRSSVLDGAAEDPRKRGHDEPFGARVMTVLPDASTAFRRN